MGNTPLRPHKNIQANEMLESIPEKQRSFLILSLEKIRQIPEDKWDDLFTKTLDALDTVNLEGKTYLAKKLGIAVDDVAAILNGAGFLVAYTTSFSELTADDLVSALCAGRLIQEDAKDDALATLRFLVERRETVNEQLELDALTNQTLPSLDRIDISVDIRLPEIDQPLSQSAPVAIAYLDTDAEGQSIWFQFSKRQAEAIQRQMEIVVKQLERAEALIMKSRDEGEA